MQGSVGMTLTSRASEARRAPGVVAEGVPCRVLGREAIDGPQALRQRRCHLIHAWEKSPLSQGRQERRRALRILHIYGVEVRIGEVVVPGVQVIPLQDPL
jgi:hypothetical protein